MKCKLRWVAGAVLAAAVMVGAVLVAFAAFSSALKPQKTLSLVVDRAERRLYVRENGKVVQSYSVAVGMRGHRTPAGVYYIRRIEWNPSWTPPPRAWARRLRYKAPGQRGNPMGSVKMYFREPYYFIHGTHAYGSIGRAASHGCVRLPNGAAISLARKLMVRGGASMSRKEVARVLDHSHRTRNIYLSHPIRLVVR